MTEWCCEKTGLPDMLSFQKENVGQHATTITFTQQFSRARDIFTTMYEKNSIQGDVMDNSIKQC